MTWNPFRRRRSTTGGSPDGVLKFGDTFYGGHVPLRPGPFLRAGRAWTSRLGLATNTLRRAAGWVVGVETRSGTEKRAITSLPWVQGGPRSSSTGVEQALHLSPVFAAGRLLAANIAALFNAIEQYRRLPDGTNVRVPLSSLFTSPTVQGTTYDWLFRAVTSMVYRGNAIGLITQRDYLENPTMIEWLDPDHVQVIDSMPNIGQPGSYTRPIWYYLGNEINAEDLLHIPWFVLPEKVLGLSPIGAYAATVSTGLSAQEFAKAWFDSGGVPPGVFQNEQQKVDQSEANTIKQRLVQAIQSREPVVFGKDWQYTPITVSANEAQFVTTMQLTSTQIANIYGIPPEMIGGTTGGSMSYSSPEQRQIELVQFALQPWLSPLEAAFSKILPGQQFIKFNADALIRPDTLTRYQTYFIARDIGLDNIDGLRAKEDMPPLPDGKGKDYTPLGVKTITQPRVPHMAEATPEITGSAGTRNEAYDNVIPLEPTIGAELQEFLEQYRYDVTPLGEGDNWVTQVGGLPLFARAIAHALIRNGHSESEAVQLAIGVIQNWASGKGKVTAKTRAKAAAALAEWNAKKAASHAT